MDTSRKTVVCVLGAVFVTALSVGFISPAAGSSKLLAGFSLQELPNAGPFLRVVLWAPPAGSPGSYDTILFIHGSQPPTIPDPAWFAEIRHYPPFNKKILIVPAVARAEEWSQPATLAALDRLLDRVSADYPVNRRQIFLAGFSSGGSQGFLVASSMAEKLAGFASMAASVSRAATRAQLAKLRDLPILLVCMQFDTAVPCSRQGDSVKRLRESGVSIVATEQIAGIGHECPFDRVAPVLARWIERVR